MGNKETILMLDINNQNIQRIEHFLRIEDYQVIKANSFEKGLDLISKRKIDLILLEVRLADTNAFDFLRSIKEDSSTVNIPVIFISAVKELEKKLKAFKLGAVDYITKPFNTEAVIAKIKMHLSIKEEIDGLKLKNEKQELLLENIETHIWYLKDPETYGEVNKAHADFLGYDKSEIAHKNIRNFYTEEEAEICRKGNLTVFEQKKRIETEELIKNKEGEVSLFSVTKIPKLNNEGQVEYVICTALDFTKQKRNEQIIKELNKVAIEFQKLDNEKEICQKTIETAREILNFDLCHVSLIKNDKLIPTAASEIMEIDTIALDYGIVGKAFKNNESYLTFNTKKDPDARPTEEIYRSGITIPMEDIGIFQAISMEENDFNQKDLELAEILVANTKAALEKLYYQKNLEHKSFYDSLTNLYNRRFFEEELERLDTKKRLPISIIMVDINGLKIINDTFGHQKGDDMLKKAADLLKDVVRDEDILARHGGDEFAILLPQTNTELAEKILDRIRSEVKKTEMEEISISLSFGLAEKTEESENIEEVFKKADDAMYQNKLLKVKSTENKIIESLLSTLSVKSKETKNHAMRMEKLAHQLGKKEGLPSSELNRLSLLAVLHDIGKATIPEEILTKTGKLTDEEWEILKRHSETGSRIAASTNEFALIAEDILSHHERWDGKGYPRGLKEEEIPFLSRLITIIDAYDVMINDRPYSKAISSEEALEEINRCAGSQFDPRLAEDFIEMMTDNHFLNNEYQ